MPQFNVTRSISINAPLDSVYNVLLDFKQWPAWSPWLIVEPDCKLDYADDGQSYRWDGQLVGSGEMVIEDVKPSARIDYRRTFLKPWKSKSSVSFELAVQGEQVDVTWNMTGSLPFFLFWMKKTMSAMVGMDYDRGLRMLKDYLETSSVPSSLSYSENDHVDEYQYVGIKNTCSIESIGDTMSADFKSLHAAAAENAIECVGMPFSLYHKWDLANGTGEYTIGFPVASIPSPLPQGLVIGTQPACDTYAIKHTGPYRHIGNAWSSGMIRARSKLFQQDKRIPPFEVYETEPETTPENELIATVHFPRR